MKQTSREQVEHTLARIAEIDPHIRSVCTLDPTALDQADACDREAATGVRGPLHGRPVLVKDNIDTAGLATTAGSLALAAADPPAADAPLVRRLRAAGLVVVGKANLSEWANFRDDESTSGWSGYGGLTRNPYALNRSAGGSSSGSGAAVGAGLVRLAVGTETDGSITCPAAFNGCVGLKPTVGTVSTRGVVPIAASMDSPGPMTATVAEAAALLTAMAETGVDYAAHAVEGRLAGKRIGVPRAPWWGYSAGADAAGEEALRLLSAAGAVVVDDVDLGALATVGWDDELAVMLAEFPAGLLDYLATRTGDTPRTVADVIDFNLRHADRELSRFGQSLLERALTVPGVNSSEYAAALARCRQVSRTDGIDRALAAHDLDALLTPAYAPAPPIETADDELLDAGSCSQPAAMAGYPLLTVPVQLADGLPVAVAFWGTAGSEPTLIEAAAGLEAARDRSLGPLPAPDLVAGQDLPAG
ncbi:amidase family protein [Nocardioides rubriscoriae]|uniref:amidase family protein n=1 Tax=Nocardioides rubriscoriae TaxID=642762 RepID=UPI0011DFBB11|nr:amidase family protein [Nocardioides rubriscoriae]